MQGQQIFAWSYGDIAATTDSGGATRQAIFLPSGSLWRIDSFYVQAETNYAATASNYQTFNLKDSSGNVIAAISNADTGVAIGPNITGADTSMVATYQVIDCTSAASYVYVEPTATGNGKEMHGVRGVVLATPLRHT